jgi:hypothetical protein
LVSLLKVGEKISAQEEELINAKIFLSQDPA